MIHSVRRKWSKKRVLSLFDPLIAEWFGTRYTELTEPQAYGIPLIHSGKNVLVSSPTGSGKTLTAFISIINELFLLAKAGELENQIYCVYISPLKALANDIHRNLEVPLEELGEMARHEKLDIPEIKVAVRSGDTSTNERQKMLRKPPHILITTPESLALALTAPKFREKFKSVRYVIVDEIHEIANNKRGVLLSLTLERLAAYAGEFQHIGLSATQAPIDEIARFLGGLQNGNERDVWIVQSLTQKDLDLKVITPVDDLTLVPYEVASEKMYDILVELINKHQTTLVFTNTRSGTEHVAYKLKERGVDKIEAHHGSLSKETRLRVENDLKNGNLKCVISSTSLELGIDIGYIDLVVQIGSPKSVAKGLQRIGRSGHAYGKIAKGRFVVFELDDLIECTTLVKCAYEGKIDRIRIPENSLDVLAQVLVGMSLEKRWDVDEAYQLIKNSYCYRNLPKEKFISVLQYLGGKVLGDEFYSKIWFDEEEQKFGKKRSSRMIYFMNIGTIPDESDYHVIDVESKRLGTLSEKFVEKLQRGDVFVLGAKSYEVLKVTHSRVVVRNVSGKRPTVPSWAGEMLPRSFDLSVEVGKFRETVENSILTAGDEKTVEMLERNYFLDAKGAKSIVSYVKEQMYYAVPTNRNVVIEGYHDPDNRHSIIFHFPFGRRVNDALSRTYAHAITERYSVNVGVSVSDDAFMLTTKRRIPIRNIIKIVTPGDIENILKDAIFGTEMFKQRFRHVATRAFMVLRRYKGKSISVDRQQLRSDRVLNILRDIQEFPVMEETFNEILNIAMDLPSAREVINGIGNGTINVKTLNYTTTPSVFAHSIILVGISDIVLMEDRSALLKELHMKLLEKVIPSNELAAMFSETDVHKYFTNKVQIKDIKTMLNFFKHAPGVDILHRRGVNIYDYSIISEEDIERIVNKLIEKEEIVSVYTTRLLWTHVSLYPVFSTLYFRECDNKIEWSGKLKVEEIAKNLNMKKKDVIEALKCMEKAYLAGRIRSNDQTYWYVTDRKTIARDYAIEILVSNLLWLRAPLTFEEIVYSLHLMEDDIRRILKYMVQEGKVIKGNFLVGYGDQYMLTEDYEILRKNAGVDTLTMQSHRSEKVIRPMNCKDYFDEFLVVFNPDSLRLRGCFEEFIVMIKKGEIAYGRFMGGRLCYTPKKNIPLIVSAYRNEKLNERDRRVISLIGALGKEATLRKIQVMSNYSTREVKKIVEKLERNIFIYRTVESLRNGKSYPYTAVLYEPEGGKDVFIKRVVAGYGPLSRDEIEWYTGINPDPYMGNFRAFQVEGKNYYGTEEELTGGEVHAVVPREDPFSYPILHSLYSSFPEVHSYILIDSGKAIATGDVEDKPDYCTVSDVLGNRKRFMEELCKLKIVVTPHKPNVKGYRKAGDYYVCGNVSKKVYSLKQIISYMLWKNHVVPERMLKTPLDVVKFLMFVRSDMEMIRARRKIEISKYYHSSLLYETVDLRGETGYATKESIALFQAIKARPMDDNMQTIYRMFDNIPSLSLKEIMAESPLGIERTQQAIKNLYNGNYLARHYSGYSIIRRKYGYEYGAQKFVENLINAFGFLNVESISYFSGNYITDDEIIRILDFLPVSRGLYLNDGNIYYSVEEEIEKTEPFDGTAILGPKDPLAEIIVRFVPQKFSGFVVLHNGKIGVVKASGKRKIKVLRASSPEIESVFLSNFNQ